MNPAEKDRQVRAAIDEYHEAIEDRARIAREAQRWQQENPPPKRPNTVESMAQIDEYEQNNQEWSEPYREQIRRQDQATTRENEATENLGKLLPQDYGYVYKGRRYSLDPNTAKVRVENWGR